MNYSERQLIVYSPQKKERSFSFLDFFVTLLCLSVAAAAIYFFYLSLTQTLTSDLDPVGTVTVKFNSVQRRMGDRVLWDRVANESPLYPGDIIRVADLSGATLNFSNNQIDLEDNTLIRVTVDRLGNPKIELASGSLNFESNEDSGSISIVAGGKIIEAEQGTLFSVTSNDDEITLSVTEGSASVKDESEDSIESIQIPAGTSLTLETDQGLETALLASIIQEIPSLEEIEMIEDTEIEELAIEPDPVIAEAPSPPPPSPPQATLPPQPPPPPPVQPLPPPLNMRPARFYTINAAEFRTIESMDFTWSRVAGANAYIFTIFQESTNREVIRTEPLSDAVYSLNNLTLLDRGTFIWQVEAVNLNANGTIQRRGTPGESSFIIDVPVPEVQINEPRNLYDN